MKTLQLNPSIPLDTPKGSGLAIMVTWLNEEHYLLWTVIQDETGEIWTWENPKVRGQKNIQMGRIIDNKKLRGDIKPINSKSDLLCQAAGCSGNCLKEDTNPELTPNKSDKSGVNSEINSARDAEIRLTVDEVNKFWSTDFCDHIFRIKGICQKCNDKI